jgi:hypothetical protein
MILVNIWPNREDNFVSSNVPANYSHIPFSCSFDPGF